MKRLAQCHCGSLRAIASDPPDRVYLCHCQACQRRTGSVIHVGTYYPKDQVTTEGEAKIYVREASEGRTVRFYFCPNCGTTVYWDAEHSPKSTGVAVGCFADPTYFAPNYSVWEQSMHPWFVLPSSINKEHRHQQRPTQPPPVIEG
jgi:hypothetical protein